MVPLHATGAMNIPIVTTPDIKCDMMGEGLSITVEIARSKLINLFNYVDEIKKRFPLGSHTQISTPYFVIVLQFLFHFMTL